jgi:uncharacterized membrane protein
VAAATSADGQAIAGTISDRNGTEAFRWRDGNLMRLGDIPNGGGATSAAAISADGRVVCGQGFRADESSVAFCWRSGTGIRVLPSLDGAQTARAAGVSTDGAVVVGSAFVEQTDIAVIWSEDSVQTVADALRAADVDIGAWRLQHVAAVTPDGTVLVGDGIAPDGTVAGWIAMLPR